MLFFVSRSEERLVIYWGWVTWAVDNRRRCVYAMSRLKGDAV